MVGAVPSPQLMVAGKTLESSGRLGSVELPPTIVPVHAPSVGGGVLLGAAVVGGAAAVAVKGDGDGRRAAVEVGVGAGDVKAAGAVGDDVTAGRGAVAPID